MKSRLRVFVMATTLWPGILLCCFLMRPPGPAWATSSGVFSFAKQIGRFTGTTFLFDPAQVQGRMTLLAPTTLLGQMTCDPSPSSVAPG